MTFTEHTVAQNITCYRGVLPNNIRVLLTPMPHTQAVSVSVNVDAGARDESDAESGIAHFLEHMAFKGTQTRTALDIAEEFDAIGGRFNAATGRESTTYYAKILKEHSTTALDILADILQRSVYAPEEIEKERQVILQEIFMTRDTPDDFVFDLYQEACFGDTGMGRSILGTEAHVSSFKEEHLRAFMQDKYTGDHIVISAAGALDPQRFFDDVAQLFGSFAPTGSYKRQKAGNFVSESRLITRDLDQAHVVFGVPGVSSLDDLYRPMQLAGMILGGGMSSRLFQEVREKRGLAYSVSAFPWGFPDTGVFSFYGGTSPDKVKEMAQVMLDETKKLADHGASDAELDRAKTQMRASILMEQEKSGFLCDYVARREIVHQHIEALPDLAQRIDTITKEDILTASQDIAGHIDVKRFALSCIGTEEANNAIRAAL